MKKYKTIDFIKLHNHNIKNIKNIYIIASLIILIVVYKFNMNIYNKETIVNEDIDINEELSKSTYINFDNIKLVFNLIGKENISRILVDNSGLEVEGECNNLDILEQLRTQSKSSYFSINNISKLDDKYIFNLKYNIGE